MGVEVVPSRTGEVRTRDVLAVYGHAIHTLTYVDVVVIADGGAPIAARVDLMQIQSGRRTLTVFVCPSCRLPRHLLRARRGFLSCSRCHRHRTRRQLERSRADWNRWGGRQEDEILRLLVPTGERPPKTLVDPSLLVTQLLQADRARVDLLRERLEGLKAVVEARG